MLIVSPFSQKAGCLYIHTGPQEIAFLGKLNKTKGEARGLQFNLSRGSKMTSFNIFAPPLLAVGINSKSLFYARGSLT